MPRSQKTLITQSADQITISQGSTPVISCEYTPHQVAIAMNFFRSGHCTQAQLIVGYDHECDGAKNLFTALTQTGETFEFETLSAAGRFILTVRYKNAK